jgi:hypothetical protein
VLIAHYLFDCIPTELLRFRHGKPERGLLSLAGRGNSGEQRLRRDELYSERLERQPGV